MLVDTRDQRLTSPFQGFFPLEIHENANSSINVLTEREMIMKPQAGHFFIMHTITTLQVFKVVLDVSIDTSQTIPMAAGDSQTRDALEHPAFAPFDWPEMTASTPTVLDVKVKAKGEVLCHKVFTAYRSDNDMSVTKDWWHSDLLMQISEDTEDFQIMVAVFQGYRVSIFSCSPGGRLYVAGPNGSVVASDFPRINSL